MDPFKTLFIMTVWLIIGAFWGILKVLEFIVTVIKALILTIKDYR